MILLQLICEIVNLKVKIDKCSRISILKKRRYEKTLQEKKNELFTYDVFCIACRFMNILSAVGINHADHEILGKNGIIEYNSDGYLKFKYEDTIIWYLVKSNRFEITDSAISYTVYYNSRVSHLIESKWKFYEMKIKNSFYNSILAMAEECYSNGRWPLW